MQLRKFLLLGMLVGAEASRLVVRQNTGSDSAAAPSTDSAPASSAAPESSPTDDAATTAADPTTAAEPTDAATTAADPTTADETTDAGTTSAGDVTVTKTVTVTDADAKTVSRMTTVMKTITSTVVVTSTAFETATVTSSDAETATETEFVTSTKWANEKRALDLAPRTIGGAELVAPAVPTTTSVPYDFHVEIRRDEYGLRAFRRGLHKRATVTETTTVTEGDGSDTTVFNTVSRTVISTISSQTKVTKTLTKTAQAGASTTVTTTSTVVITSTRVTTGVVRTATVAPSGEYGPAGTGGASSDDNNNSSKSSDDEGLSTGAKAGIGAGVGVAGLIVIGGLIYFCLRKRRNAKNKAEYDDVFGASEVPVGGRGGGGGGGAAAVGTSPHMSQTSPAAASTLAPSRNTTMSEGYRGTALGDGRAGFAKPQQYGRNYAAVSPETNYSRTAGSDQAFSAVTPENNYANIAGHSPHNNAAEMYSPANTAELASDSAATKWHQNDAAEIDGNQVSSARGTAPPEHVYEMPAQPYR
ncbi:hypothetical protein SNK04_012785 [Fusarium graminearum]